MWFVFNGKIQLFIYCRRRPSLLKVPIKYVISLFSNRVDTTRLAFTIPLRESFGFPFLYTQIAIVTAYFKSDISSKVQVNYRE